MNPRRCHLVVTRGVSGCAAYGREFVSPMRQARDDEHRWASLSLEALAALKRADEAQQRAIRRDCHMPECDSRAITGAVSGHPFKRGRSQLPGLQTPSIWSGRRGSRWEVEAGRFPRECGPYAVQIGPRTMIDSYSWQHLPSMPKSIALVVENRLERGIYRRGEVALHAGPSSYRRQSHRLRNEHPTP